MNINNRCLTIGKIVAVKKLKDIIQKKYPGHPQLLLITSQEEIVENRKKVPVHIWNKLENDINGDG